MTARITSLLLLGALAALLAGCGGDKRRAEGETETQATTQPAAAVPKQPAPSGTVRVSRITDPARRTYVNRVDAICRRIDPERAGQEERVRSSPDTTEAAKAYDDSIALGWRELRMIEAIPPPPGDVELVKANVLEPVRAQLALRARISRALAAADVPLLRRLRAEIDDSSRAIAGFARGYGFQTCGAG